MNWEKYKSNLIEACVLNDKNEEYKNKIIAYSYRLTLKNLPIIYTPNHLSMLVGIDYSYLCSMAYSTHLFYRSFSIPKKSGGKRKIDEPLPDLKYVQKWILDNILSKIPVSKYSKAYVKGLNLKHNAKFHRKQPYVVTMDIKDFFPSIHISRIIKTFDTCGYSHPLSCFMAHLCCLNDGLPQGAPTSPYLSNIIMQDLDEDFGEYAFSHSIRYTRYADDLTFSGLLNPQELICYVSNTVWAYGFSVNSKKTRVLRGNNRQVVTGIVVNSHMQITREKRKRIRQEIYYIKKYGLNSHLEHIKEVRAHYLEHLLGQVNHALFVNPNDAEMRAYAGYLISMIKGFHCE